jgi:hypothetical protein
MGAVQQVLADFTDGGALFLGDLLEGGAFSDGEQDSEQSMSEGSAYSGYSQLFGFVDGEQQQQQQQQGHDPTAEQECVSGGYGGVQHSSSEVVFGSGAGSVVCAGAVTQEGQQGSRMEVAIEEVLVLEQLLTQPHSAASSDAGSGSASSISHAVFVQVCRTSQPGVKGTASRRQHSLGGSDDGNDSSSAAAAGDSNAAAAPTPVSGSSSCLVAPLPASSAGDTTAPAMLMQAALDGCAGAAAAATAATTDQHFQQLPAALFASTPLQRAQGVQGEGGRAWLRWGTAVLRAGAGAVAAVSAPLLQRQMVMATLSMHM